MNLTVYNRKMAYSLVPKKRWDTGDTSDIKVYFRTGILVFTHRGAESVKIDESKGAVLLFDREAGIIGFRPATENDTEYNKIYKDKSGRYSLQVKGLLRVMGFKATAIKKYHLRKTEDGIYWFKVRGGAIVTPRNSTRNKEVTE